MAHRTVPPITDFVLEKVNAWWKDKPTIEKLFIHSHYSTEKYPTEVKLPREHTKRMWSWWNSREMDIKLKVSATYASFRMPCIKCGAEMRYEDNKGQRSYTCDSCNFILNV